MLTLYAVVEIIERDGDHVPLVRKLHALGCKTMLCAWDFALTDELSGEHQTTRTSTDLWNNVTYPLEMSDLVEEGLQANDEVVTDLFVSKEVLLPRDPATDPDRPLISMSNYEDNERHTSSIMSLHKGYGFIRFPETTLFSPHDDLVEVDFNTLAIDDMMEFSVAVNSKGQRVAKRIKRAGESSPQEEAQT